MNKNYRLKLRHHEYNTLLTLMQAAMEFMESKNMQEKLISCLMLRLYKRLHAKSIDVLPQYSFTIPIEEAIAFHIFWRTTGIKDFIVSALVNRIIGEIDQKYAQNAHNEKPNQRVTAPSA